MIIYSTRYKARKAKRYGEKVVRICCGYILMTCEEYAIWKKQK